MFLFPFRLQAFYKPTPVPRKSTFNVQFHSSVILFSVNFRVRVRVRVSYRVRVRVYGLGFGNLKHI